MIINKGEKILLNLQLIRSDNITVEEEADITFKIFDSTATIECVSETVVTYNENTKSYLYSLDPTLLWTNQQVGSYLILWYIENTEDDFNSVYTEELTINIDNTDIQKILGLIHQNMEIDEAEYDEWHNLVSARVFLYTDPTKSTVLTTYKITCDTFGPGKFNTWSQVEE